MNIQVRLFREMEEPGKKEEYNSHPPGKPMMEMIKDLTDKVYAQAIGHAMKIVDMHRDIDNPIPKILNELADLKNTPTP